MSDAGQLGSSIGDDGQEASLACGCAGCDDERRQAEFAVTGSHYVLLSRFMILCPSCGNKRCPRASWHGNACTASNDPGQTGSAYGPPTPARPVPPVVPDSEPVLVASLAEAVAAIRKRNWAEQVVPDRDGEVQPLDLTDDERAGLVTALDELHVSGVVPDKPALAPCGRCGHRRTSHGGIYGTNECRQAGGGCMCRAFVSVPAVTDDEAATKALAAALNAAHLIQDDGGHGLSHPDECSARAVLADLRSAGFLIVHHTKET